MSTTQADLVRRLLSLHSELREVFPIDQKIPYKLVYMTPQDSETVMESAISFSLSQEWFPEGPTAGLCQFLSKMKMT